MAANSARVLIQGASRGIGLQFCRSLLAKRPDVGMVATCRSPESANELQALKAEPANSNRLHVLKVDVTHEQSIQDAANFVESQFDGLDLLINCAGILHPTGKGETSLRDVNLNDLIQTCSTNAFGPLLMVKHFSKLLGKGSGMYGVQGADAKSQHAAVLVNISAKVGSITDNALGGWYSYRMSKSALNMATKTISIELGRGKKRVICAAIHPGTVDTALSRPYHKNVKNLFSTELSVEKMLNVIDGLTVEDSGKFFTYDKELLPF